MDPAWQSFGDLNELWNALRLFLFAYRRTQTPHPLSFTVGYHSLGTELIPGVNDGGHDRVEA